MLVEASTNGFSAIARSVMISASKHSSRLAASSSFSAIARSVMISAGSNRLAFSRIQFSFSAIARSVMISASPDARLQRPEYLFQCYSS